MRGYWIKVTDGQAERWTVMRGDDGFSAHMKAETYFHGTKWRVCWP